MNQTRVDISPPLENDDEIRLDPWEEIRGQFENIEEGEHFCKFILSSGVVRLNADSRPAERLREKLDGHQEAKVSIIRTDSKTDPYRARLDEPSDADSF
jgi:hypothetical protein